MKKLLFTALCITMLIHSRAQAQAQAQANYAWHEPKWANGICERDSSHVFYRLPGYMEPLVRKAVWDLSLNTAGEFLHFRTTARTIVIKYTLASKNLSLPHMPATGVSGVDLYALDMNGDWNWSPPKYSFGDTCVFAYKNLRVASNRGTSDFYLYLPLYNTIQWISIGVPENEKFAFTAERQEKPIVAYGTSILQGAVASRPGLAWSNILERNLDREVINLGFSGNGRFEKPIFDLMAKVDAKLYILDCMPNLTRGAHIPDEEVKARVYYGITHLREKHPDVPILLTEHADGYTPFNMDTALLNDYHETSLVMAKIYADLKNDGIKNIYLLSDQDIHFDINSTTEGTHPNDIGMLQYANAYEDKIRQILHEPKGSLTTQIPAEQYRDGYDWINRHGQVMDNTIHTDARVMLFGNSIINYWGGLPAAENGTARGEAAWEKYLLPGGVQNAGFGWDRIENVLWRIYHGELDHFNGNKIILMIGTNNLSLNTDEDIVDGLAFLLQQIRSRKPDARIWIAGILPRKGMEERVRSINQKIRKMAMEHRYLFADFSKNFLTGKNINPSLFIGDGLHPDKDGYDVLGKDLQGLLK